MVVVVRRAGRVGPAVAAVMWRMWMRVMSMSRARVGPRVERVAAADPVVVVTLAAIVVGDGVVVVAGAAGVVEEGAAAIAEVVVGRAVGVEIAAVD